MHTYSYVEHHSSVTLQQSAPPLPKKQRLAYHFFVRDEAEGVDAQCHLVGKESKFEEEYRHRLKFHTIDLAVQVVFIHRAHVCACA